MFTYLTSLRDEAQFFLVKISSFIYETKFEMNILQLYHPLEPMHIIKDNFSPFLRHDQQDILPFISIK